MDIFDRYFAYVDNTEPPKIFHLWSLLAGISALAGRKIWFHNGPMVTYPNLYVMLIGSPGTRKSTAIKQTKKIMKQAGYKTFAADRSTKPKFLLDLEAGFDFDTMQANTAGQEETGLGSKRVTKILESSLDDLIAGGPSSKREGPSEVCIAADEFLDFFGRGDIDFATLLGVLWDKDDDYTDRIKNTKSVCITEPTVSIIGGSTHENFKMMFPPELLGQGFISRLLLIYGESSGKRITFLADDDEDAKAALATYMAAIANTHLGRVNLTDEAMKALDDIYQAWEDLEDARFRYYSTRRFTQLIKIMLVLAAARLSAEVSFQDVVLANTVLAHAELHMPKAMGEYGKAKNAEILHKIMDVLNHTSTPLTYKEIWKQVANDLDSMSALLPIMQGLVEADKIQKVPGTVTYLPKKKPGVRKSSLLHVDWNLMKRFGIDVY